MRRIVPPLLLVLALVLGACGEPVTIETPEGPVTIESPPERIVSLSATSTEILFAIGAGDRVVASDLHSDHPAEARQTEKVDAFDLNVEAVAALDPDLVVLSFDPGNVVAALGELGIPALFHPAAADLDDVYLQIEQLGVATGRPAEAAGLVAEMQAEIEAVVASAPPTDGALTYYYELDPTYFSLTSDTFVGRLLSLIGLESIADAADVGPYPQLSVEFILEADPDLILLADTICCDVTAESVAERAGWDTLSAVRAGRVVELPDDVASRWGPRVVTLLRMVATELEALPAETGG